MQKNDLHSENTVDLLRAHENWVFSPKLEQAVIFLHPIAPYSLWQTCYLTGVCKQWMEPECDASAGSVCSLPH